MRGLGGRLLRVPSTRVGLRSPSRPDPEGSRAGTSEGDAWLRSRWRLTPELPNLGFGIQVARAKILRLLDSIETRNYLSWVSGPGGTVEV
jgi:hypothetical protein